jgi:hypothetical protein
MFRAGAKRWSGAPPPNPRHLSRRFAPLGEWSPNRPATHDRLARAGQGMGTRLPALSPRWRPRGVRPSREQATGRTEATGGPTRGPSCGGWSCGDLRI